LKTNVRVQLQHDESAEYFAKQLLDTGNGKKLIDIQEQPKTTMLMPSVAMRAGYS
jgi:hypothetical protein